MQFVAAIISVAGITLLAIIGMVRNHQLLTLRDKVNRLRKELSEEGIDVDDLEKDGIGFTIHSRNGRLVLQLRRGDKVCCHLPGSWVDGQEGEIIATDATSSDGIRGYALQMKEGVTVVEACYLERVNA